MKTLYSFLTAAAVLTYSAISFSQEKIIILNEGIWQSDNGRISYFEDDHVVSNQWFRDVNGEKLGDTPNDIIHVAPNLIAITVNWSNIIQFIDSEGHAIAATEDIPNNRKLATDGRYVYVTSYGHECATSTGTRNFTKGFVAKIDVTDFKVTDAVEVGYEPEGIAYYKGKLFVANTGGYAFQENHDYEQTVSMIDAEAMEVERNIDTGQINLYGKMSQSGQYLCINSPGDYYDVAAATIIFDCDAAIAGKSDNECFVKLDYAATYSTTTMSGDFYAIGARYSYYTGDYRFNYITIDPKTVMNSGGREGVTESLPGTLLDDIKKMAMPYGLYVNPFSGYIYATDAAGFAEGGTLHQWNPQGEFTGKYGLYINPGHFLALDPKGESGIKELDADVISSDAIYNLQGIKVEKPIPGEIYIRNGKKMIFK